MGTTGDKVDGRTLRHQHRRPELLAAAVDYVLEHGVAELTLRPMAQALGVSHATLIRHFGTKEALVAEVISAIRLGVFETLAASTGDLSDVPVADSMRIVWRQLCEPKQRRQFVLLFEVVAIEARHPDRFGGLATLLISDFLSPIESELRAAGRSPDEARHIATGFLALVRGLQLDLAVTGDIDRVDAAMNRYIAAVTADSA